MVKNDATGIPTHNGYARGYFPEYQALFQCQKTTWGHHQIHLDIFIYWKCLYIYTYTNIYIYMHSWFSQLQTSNYIRYHNNQIARSILNILYICTKFSGRIPSQLCWCQWNHGPRPSSTILDPRIEPRGKGFHLWYNSGLALEGLGPWNFGAVSG